MRYRVAVEKDDGTLANHWRQLGQFGLRKVSDTKYSGEVNSERRLRNIRLFCRRNHARFYYDDPRWTRNTDYRNAFFRANAPLYGHTYRCVYCGRKKRQEDITIDHVYPVAKVSSSMRLQKKLMRRGINSVNSTKNLVPACMKCNMRKGTHMGIWIFRAKIGKSEALWKMRKSVRFAAAAGTAFLIAGIWSGRLSLDYLINYRLMGFLQWIQVAIRRMTM